MWAHCLYLYNLPVQLLTLISFIRKYILLSTAVLPEDENMQESAQLYGHGDAHCKSLSFFKLFSTDRPGVNPTLFAQWEDRDTCDRSGPTSHRWQTFGVAPRLSDKHLSPLQKAFFETQWFLNSATKTLCGNFLLYLLYISLADSLVQLLATYFEEWILISVL